MLLSVFDFVKITQQNTLQIKINERIKYLTRKIFQITWL